MKRILSLLLVALLLCGCNPAAPAQPADTTVGDTAADAPTDTAGTPETEPPQEENLAYTQPITVEYDTYTVTLSAPVVVSRSTVGDDSWGHTQFPSLRFSKEGYLLAYWMYGDDIVGGKSVMHNKVSLNGGANWLPNAGGYGSNPAVHLMPNGKYFYSFKSAGTVTVQQVIDSYTPAVYCNDGKRLYFAEDLESCAEAVEKGVTSLSFYEYDPETETMEVVPCTLNWPYAPVAMYSGGLLYTVSGLFGLSGNNVIAGSDGTLYACIYGTGFDSTATSRGAAVTEIARRGMSSVYVFSSEDSGRTWNFIAQHIPGDEIDQTMPGFEGYTEPKMVEMPDGSLLMLMRTGGGIVDYCPMYVTRSTDKGHTWTTPAPFDYCGVLPQLLRLDCGVTLASYGRPELFLRTTDDPSGVLWDEHIEVLLSYESKNYMQRSCFYTGMIATGENTAVLVYSDFKYPNKKGEPVKTILTRNITVTPNE